MPTALELEMSAFLNQYNETFATFDGDQIAEFYCVPTITMRGDGSIHCFQSREEIVRFFQGVADTYKGEGTKGGTIHDLVAVPIGERSALATLTWKNVRADGSVATQWRQDINRMSTHAHSAERGNVGADPPCVGNPCRYTQSRIAPASLSYALNLMSLIH
jgi:hypothetical protein